MNEEEMKALIESSIATAMVDMENQIKTLRSSVETKDKEIADLKSSMERNKASTRNAILQAKTTTSQKEDVDWDKPFELKDLTI